MKRVVLVKSCQRFRDRRDACEQTWAGKLRDSGVPVYFVEGGYWPQSVVGNLICASTGDGYDDNSFKVRDAIRLLLCSAAIDHLFICDDDTFVHWRRWLAFEPQAEFVGLADLPKVPWWHGGGGAFFSRRAAELFAAGITKRCSWDDRLASEILSKHGIEIDNHPELFSQWPKDRVSADNGLITCHKVEPKAMVELYEATHDL